MFRHGPTRGQTGPPSAFPGSALSPGVGPSDLSSSNGSRTLRNRISRTDLDFEQALKANVTMRISDGVDINDLGKDASLTLSPATHRAFLSPSPSPINPSSSTTSTTTGGAPAPATPTVVPPTPPQFDNSSAGRTRQRQQPQPSKLPARAGSPSLARDDNPFMDASTPDRVNRRSMYRSPGTSSSPDLATLLKKAKREGTELKNSSHYKEKRREEPPPLPTGVAPRQRASTGIAAPTSPNKLQRPLPPSPNPSAEWVMPSPNVPRENGTIKVRVCLYIYSRTLPVTHVSSSWRRTRRRTR